MLTNSELKYHHCDTPAANVGEAFFECRVPTGLPANDPEFERQELLKRRLRRQRRAQAQSPARLGGWRVSLW